MSKNRHLTLLPGSHDGHTAPTESFETSPPLVLTEGDRTKPKGRVRRALGSLGVRTPKAAKVGQPKLLEQVDKGLIVQTRGQALFTFAQRRNESMPNFQDHTRDLTYRLQGRDGRMDYEVTIATNDKRGPDNLESMRITRVPLDGHVPNLACILEFDGDKQPGVFVPGENGRLEPSLEPRSFVEFALELARRGER